MNAVRRLRHHEVDVIHPETTDAKLDALRQGLEDVREDVRDLRTDLNSLRDKVDKNHSEMHTEFAAVRNEMHTEFAAVRSEMRTEFAAVRSEMRTEFAAVRNEMRTEFTAVRGEMNTGFVAIRSEMYAGFNVLRESITGLEKSVASLRAMMKTALVVITLGATFAGIFFAAGNSLNWFKSVPRGDAKVDAHIASELKESTR